MKNLNKIIHKFYFVGLILFVAFGLGYSQLAFFLHDESKSVLKVQKIQTIKSDIQDLRRSFIEARFWERVILSQSTPEAERRYGQLQQMIHQLLETLQQSGLLVPDIHERIESINNNFTDYEIIFAEIVQLETKQRLSETLSENVYQSLIANILKSSDNNLLHPAFSLSQFQQRYQSRHRASEYQALQIVLQSLESKFAMQPVKDSRLPEYIIKYNKLLDDDFARDQKIQHLNQRFDAISDQVGVVMKTSIELINSAVVEEKKNVNQLRERLKLSFLVSMTLMIIGAYLISAYIFRQIINPIQSLLKVSRNVREGKMSSRFTPWRKNSDELTELGTSFNVMLDTLANREQELAQHLDSLEEQIFSRTERLKMSNMALNKEVARRIEVERQLQQYADTKAILLQEVNHRVKNNLMSIISMLHQEEDRVGGYNAECGSEYGQRLQEIIGRISGLLTVHSMLSSSQWAPLPLYLLSKNIIDNVFKEKSIDFEVAPGDAFVDSDQAYYIAIVLNELATNTKKYAFNQRNTVKVQVTVVVEGDSICLEYRDDGSGYPESVLKGDYRKECIGFQLISGIISKSLQGRYEFRNDKGALARIVFPVRIVNPEKRE